MVVFLSEVRLPSYTTAPDANLFRGSYRRPRRIYLADLLPSRIEAPDLFSEPLTPRRNAKPAHCRLMDFPDSTWSPPPAGRGLNSTHYRDQQSVLSPSIRLNHKPSVVTDLMAIADLDSVQLSSAGR